MKIVMMMLGFLGSGLACLAQTEAPAEELDLAARRQSVVAMREQSPNFPLEQILDCKMSGVRIMSSRNHKAIVNRHILASSPS